MILRRDTVDAVVDVSPKTSIEVLEISQTLKQNLQKMEIQHLFPIQLDLLSKLKSTKNYSRFRANDLLVNASTGSGKTLAYAIPIVEALLDRIVPRTRCLVVVPTRDLALQVKETFDQLIVGTGLSLGLAIGSTSFQLEQNHLMTINGETKCDILVATPGRLIDHLESGLSLSTLRFLVLDEADRLMTQYYHGWLDILYSKFPSSTLPRRLGQNDDYTFPVLKLLFSATISTDPRELESLQLYQPILVSLGDSQTNTNITLPATLEEGFMVLEQADKPLFILEQLLTKDSTHILVFVNSIEKAERLSDLINSCLENNFSLPMSSNQSNSDRKKAIQKFKSGSVRMLIATDLLCRGVDFGSNVSMVINYDLPNNLITFVHRVGRTARAGKPGLAWTLVEPPQAHWFKKTILDKSLARNIVKRRHFREQDYETLMEQYRNGLDLIKQKYNKKDAKDLLSNPKEATNVEMEIDGEKV